MPELKVGDIVLWCPDKKLHTDLSPAIVTQVNIRTINVTVFQRDMVGGDPRDSVRHYTDPRIMDDDLVDSGCWVGKEEWESIQDKREAERQAKEKERAKQHEEN